MKRLDIFNIVMLVIVISAVITVAQDGNGRLNKVTITENNQKPLIANYTYVDGGLSIRLTGNRSLLPSYADLLSLIDAKFTQNIQSPTFLYNPQTGINEIQRTPTIFKQAFAHNAGDTPLWTPSIATMRFRLLGGILTLTKDAACAGAFQFTLDETLGGIPNVILTIGISGGALVAMGQVTVMPFNLPGNGYLSQQPGNSLLVSLGNALTAGVLEISVWGTEE